MEKNILIPTDFSKNAWDALQYAKYLFKDVKTCFYILNVFTVNNYKNENFSELQTGDEAYVKAKMLSEMALEKLIKSLSLQEENPNLKFETISVFNTVLGGIKETVRKKDIDMIVMGTKGENDPVNKIYGSITEEVMDKIQSCPVTVVPGNTKVNTEMKEIVFATDFQHFYKKSEIAMLSEIASRLNVPVRVLYISAEKENLTPQQEENKEVLEVYLSNVESTFHTLTKVKVPTGINTFIESRGSSFLALYHRSHGFFTKLFTTSLAKKMVFNPKVPVLILKE